MGTDGPSVRRRTTAPPRPAGCRRASMRPPPTTVNPTDARDQTRTRGCARRSAGPRRPRPPTSSAGAPTVSSPRLQRLHLVLFGPSGGGTPSYTSGDEGGTLMAVTDPVLDASLAVPAFETELTRHALSPLTRSGVATLQVNVGKRCNQACHHCHVDASPQRTESMDRRVAERVLDVLAANDGVGLVDITGGAPELNENFRFLVSGARSLGRSVIDRCNLTVLAQPGQEDTADFLAGLQVAIMASLPCYTKENVEKQRGSNV